MTRRGWFATLVAPFMARRAQAKSVYRILIPLQQQMNVIGQRTVVLAANGVFESGGYKFNKPYGEWRRGPYRSRFIDNRIDVPGYVHSHIERLEVRHSNL